MSAPKRDKAGSAQPSPSGAAETGGHQQGVLIPAGVDTPGVAPADASSSFQPTLPVAQKETTEDKYRRRRGKRTKSQATASTQLGLPPPSTKQATADHSSTASSAVSGTSTTQGTTSSSPTTSKVTSLLTTESMPAVGKPPRDEAVNEVVERSQGEILIPASESTKRPSKADTISRTSRESLATKGSIQSRTQESIKALNNLLPDAPSDAASVANATPGTATRQLREGPPQSNLLPAVAICVVAGAIILVLLRWTSRKAPHYCVTKSCAEHRGLIESQLDNMVNPCDDFAAHVCGKWAPPKDSSVLSYSALMNMVTMWLRKLPGTLDKSSTQLPVGKKAAAMFNSCMTQSGSYIGVLKDFMREHGLAWQETPSDKDPIEVLFDLAFNWFVSIWFSLKILPGTPENHQKRRILIAPNERMLQWRNIFISIPKKYFETVYNSMFQLFSNDSKVSPSPGEIEEDYKMLQAVFDIYLTKPSRKALLPLKVTFGGVESLRDVVGLKSIKYSLNIKLGINPPFTMDELMLVSDLSPLRATYKVFRQAEVHAWRRHFALLFLHAYAPVADPEAILLLLHGSKHWAREQRRLFCASQVEASYKLLVAAMATVAYFSRDERWSVDRHLDGILEMVVEKTRGASWLDKETTHVAVEKLSNVRRVLWPADKFLTAQGLEEAYANFTETASSFAEFWIKTRRSLRGLVGSDIGFQEQRIRDSTTEPYVQYMDLLNEVSLSVGALAPPIYYKDGTKAMLYGGLGYVYAKQLVGVVDSEGVKVDPLGNVVSTWLSQAVKPEFEKRVFGCLRGGTNVFPEVPGMEVAYAAFKRDYDNSGSQLSEELTEEKVFFITACLSSCAKSPSFNLYGGDCNKAMANFMPFAEAFQCAAGSNMNPAEKCTFFT